MAIDQGARPGVRCGCGRPTWTAGGVPHPLRPDAGGADAERALHARDRSRPSHPRHREGRSRLRGLRVPRGERGGPGAGGEAPGASAVEDIDEPGGGRRVRLTRAERLPDRGGVRASRRCPPIPVARTADEHGRRAPAARRQADAAAASRRRRSSASGTACMGTPKVRETVAVVPRHARLHLLGRRVRGRARTTSSARSTAATAATSTSTTTRSSA